MSLKDKAMLINLSISAWTNSQQDKKVSAEIEAQHGAHDAGRYNKTLVDKAHLDPLTKFAAAVRAYHYKMTLPWMDNGTRLLPAAVAMEYFAQIRAFKQQYEALVNQFVHLYSTQLVADARRRLGTLYNPDDYPPAAEMALKFGITTDLQPVSEGADFRVSIGDDEVAAIQRDIDAKATERTKAAQAAAWSRLRDAVQNIQIRLSAPKVIIRDSLIENARELARVMPGLNVQGDPHMAHVCKRISEELLISPEVLRRSEHTRKSLAEKAEAILREMPHG